MQKKAAKSDNDTVSKTVMRAKPGSRLDRDEIPDITDAMLDRAEVIKDGKVIQRGRPSVRTTAKTALKLSLDSDVVEAYRAIGSGWQSQINADLRRARKLKNAV